jgi:hypothetical protein
VVVGHLGAADAVALSPAASISRPAPIPSSFWKIDPALMRTAPGGCFSARQRAFMSRTSWISLGSRGSSANVTSRTISSVRCRRESS